jgi:hypothetical protein
MAKITCKTCDKRFNVHNKKDLVCTSDLCPIKYNITGLQLEFAEFKPAGDIEIISDVTSEAPKPSEGEAAHQKWLEEGGIYPMM